MGKILGLFVVTLALIIGMSAGPGVAQRLDDRNDFQRRAEQIKIERAAFDLEQYQQRERATFAGKLAGDYGLMMLLLVGGAGILYIMLDGYQQRRHPMVRPDARGYLPVSRTAIDLNDERLISAVIRSIDLSRLAEIERAHQSGQVPLHFSPHIDYAAPLPAPASGAADTQSVSPSAPTVSSLLASGWRPTRQHMLLGYGDDGAIYGGIAALLSTAIAGRPGTGKSTLLRLIYLQVILAGGTVAILDPHGSILDATGAAPAQFVAGSGNELNNAAGFLIDELERRLTLYRAGKRDFVPMLTLCDEFPVISLVSKGASGAIGRVVLEGRKCGMYSLISGQGLPAEQFGGRLVRDALSSRYIFKTTAAEGRRAGLTGDAARMVETLSPGYAVLDGPTDRPMIVAIPNCTADDLATIAGDRGTVIADSSLNQPTPSSINSAAERHKPHSAEDERIISLFLDGKETGEIVTALTGMKSSAGRPYQTRLREVQAVLRLALKDRE